MIPPSFCRIYLLVAAMISAAIIASQAQSDIPIGAWRMHLSFHNVVSVARAPDRVYAATEMAVLIFDRSDHSLSTYTKLSGLTSSGISVIAYDEDTDQLMVTYRDGNIDIVKNEVIRNFSRLKDLNTGVTDKTINHVLFDDNVAYLSTPFGVVLYDLALDEIRETWRDLGPGGATLRVNQSLVAGDSILLATGNGVLAGNLDDNLLDYTKWRRYDSGVLAGAVESIAVFGGQLYAAIDNEGLYIREESGFSQTAFPAMDFHELQVGAGTLILTTTDAVWVMDAQGAFSVVAEPKITAPRVAVRDEDGTFWIGDSRNGLISNAAGTFDSYLPNGPAFAGVSRLAYSANKMFAIAGGYSAAGIPLGNSGTYSYFENGLWTPVETGLTDLTDITSHGGQLFASSFGRGLLKSSGDNAVVYDETNSPLGDGEPSNNQVYVTDLESTPSGLWVTNYGASPGLFRFDGTAWEDFDPGFVQGRYPLEIASDPFGFIWIAVDPARGGGLIVLDPQTKGSEYLGDAPGNGSLPSREVYSLAADRDGNMWVGTKAGVCYFYSVEDDAVRPIYESRFLLKDETITDIEVDGGNRKWIATRRGVWLFNPSGDELVFNFTVDNSPLPSNDVFDIAINDQSGEVFFATANGIASFRSGATIGADEFQDIKIFPNPVTNGYVGNIGISGLATDAIVKITDVNGKLISEVRANGGTAVWNLLDERGRRPKTGIYLVFGASEDGTERIVGKIAIVD